MCIRDSQLIRIDVAALHEPRAEKEVLAEKDDALSRGADTEIGRAHV